VLVSTDNRIAHHQLAWYGGICYSLCGQRLEPTIHEAPDDASMCPECARILREAPDDPGGCNALCA